MRYAGLGYAEPDRYDGPPNRSGSTTAGVDGSGHRFVADAETLLIYASQFHPEERAYDRIIEKVDRLEGDHPVLFAHASVAVLSAHLRWGFWLMYDRDPIKMRRDNTGDYPWLLNSVLTLAREFSSSVSKGESVEERAAITQSLLQGSLRIHMHSLVHHPLTHGLCRGVC